MISEKVFKEQIEKLSKEMKGMKTRLDQTLNEMKVQVSEMRTELNDQRKSVVFLSEGYDKLKEENERMAERLKVLEKKSGAVEKKLETGEEKLARVDKLEDRAREMEEQKDKERRKKNLIFYNLPEGNSHKIEERIKEDWLSIKKVFERKGLEMDKKQVGNLYRLGKERKPGKMRPLLVRFESEEDKKEVLRFCKDLKWIRENESVPISYSMDLTLKEREERRKLVAELRKMKENGQVNVAIRNGKIVNIIESRPHRISWASLFKV